MSSCYILFFVYPYLSAGIEFWGYFHRINFNELIILQKKRVRLMCNAIYYEHCAPLAKQLNVLMINDLYEYTSLVLMFKVFNCVCCPKVINFFLSL